MKRMLLLAVTASALVVAAPGVASARHHGKRHLRHHSRHAHLVKFGKASLSTTPSGPTAKSPTAPSEPAGTVASFENGILTITLADKSTVSGKVTDATKLECRSASTGDNVGDDDNGGGDDNNFGGDEHSSLTAHASDNQSGSGGDDGDDDDNGTQAACTTAALVPGAVVAEAELLVGSGGAVWEKVELQK